jgi:hypothetical protein
MKRIIAVMKVRRLQKILSTLTPEMLYRLEQDLPATVRRAKFKAVRGRKSVTSDKKNRPELRVIAGGRR